MHAKAGFFMSTGMAALLAASSGAWANNQQAQATLSSTPASTATVAVSENHPRGGGFLADFGTREVGTILRAILGYSSVGEASITNIEVGPITGPGAIAFEIFNDQCTGATLPPGEQCTITIDFAPPEEGLFEAQFVITSTSVNSPETISLIGRGIIDKIFHDRFE
jgi:hypothetical protein